ncbi:hypoxanthine phosphoribosyltransferase [Aurantimicrobium minutum]|uniref:hypoxanthine phosphoribosyltransferase n=1 Tax=Aurantimicrobium minutum TaxID=708131 RepID=UPI0024754FC5|nr:hypoxanthine phosphoribosyltransferase [Aurantimicrobium minutum]MDH6423568.1 hypoxanthine phosphoribosyltransferase [Aurantimicrobium minutum]
MELRDVESDITETLFTEEQIQNRLAELAREIERDYEGKDVLIIAVLKGAVMVLTDLVRELKFHAHIDFMAVSSYGSSTKSSGVVRIVKDLDAEIAGRHVLIVEDIIDSGLTLNWLMGNLESRGPASIEVVAMFRKPEAIKEPVDVKYVGFDIPPAFVIGYGLDYNEDYRNVRGLAVLAPHVYGGEDPHA